MKHPRNTGAIFNALSRLERQMGVDVGLRDTTEHLYKPLKHNLTLPLTPTVIRQQNAASRAVTN